MKPSLVTKIGRLDLKSPFIAAAGSWSYGAELVDHPAHAFLGSFVTKSLSLFPSSHATELSFVQTDAGMVHDSGMENIGIDSFISTVDPLLRTKRSPYILSIQGKTAEDFKQLTQKAAKTSALAVELNLSALTAQGGDDVGSHAKSIEAIVGAVRREWKKPLLVKLSSNYWFVEESAIAAESAGADGIVMINAVASTAIDIDSLTIENNQRRFRFVTGHLSGPAIRPIAINCVFRCFRKVKIPIIGVGGIHRARDVIEFLAAGASAVQLGVWNFRDPMIYQSLTRDLLIWMESNKFKSIKDLTGLAHVDQQAIRFH